MKLTKPTGSTGYTDDYGPGKYVTLSCALALWNEVLRLNAACDKWSEQDILHPIDASTQHQPQPSEAELELEDEEGCESILSLIAPREEEPAATGEEDNQCECVGHHNAWCMHFRHGHDG